MKRSSPPITHTTIRNTKGNTGSSGMTGGGSVTLALDTFTMTGTVVVRGVAPESDTTIRIIYCSVVDSSSPENFNSPVA